MTLRSRQYGCQVPVAGSQYEHVVIGYIELMLQSSQEMFLLSHGHEGHAEDIKDLCISIHGSGCHGLTTANTVSDEAFLT